MKQKIEKFYLTKEGLDDIKKEREKVFQAKKAKTNDPEEDEDEILFLNQRLEEIDNILKSYELIELPPKELRNVVDLGAIITVQTDGHTSDLRIVGTAEANPSIGKVSNESPVGKAFLGHKVGDVVSVGAKLKLSYKIKKIKYESC